MLSVYLFKRDLRLDDNKALFEALKNSSKIIPIFVFNKTILKEFNAYNQKVGFVVDVLKNISKKINLYVFHGEDDEILEFLFSNYKPDALYTAQSFSWQGEERDRNIEKVCQKYNVKFHAVFDNYLADFRKIPYTKVFTPFYKKWLGYVESQEYEINIEELKRKVVALDLDTIDTILVKFPELNQKNEVFTYDYGFERLRSYDFAKYQEQRDFPGLDMSSRLSPYIRFGVLSIRKIHNIASKVSPEFVRQLAWREFWYHIKYNFSEFNKLEFLEKRRNVRWRYDEKLFEKFINAQTGYPIVDAGIRQLKQENWMHNRVRLIVANFLVKDLLIDWRIGEKFFREYLLDYDEVLNVGNWQWSASVGPDPKPLRIFNPMIQSEKFDPNCEYIKKYIPELKNEENYKIHNPLEYKLNYYETIVNHYEAVQITKRLYKGMDV
ncbi:deoxyribodipyrimidine photo-lyase [Fervidobacterium sp. 2310opik-2]|uniref:cryptochrome/photolyase family protein n=1 Tax=Fervidobacterium sp. 2310opik-2 TaxID=1755815 RepID=UPI0013DF916D|nr:deoxyribodipyrimidine photo-lyase [Fervidobacterium sp. 2310opik-2]KAF2961023.1 deoxyribodipyrimidine photolyase [Fervidobacterium sp. 2310opik-2]